MPMSASIPKSQRRSAVGWSAALAWPPCAPYRSGSVPPPPSSKKSVAYWALHPLTLTSHPGCPGIPARWIPPTSRASGCSFLAMPPMPSPPPKLQARNWAFRWWAWGAIAGSWPGRCAQLPRSWAWRPSSPTTTWQSKRPWPRPARNWCWAPKWSATVPNGWGCPVP